MKLKCYIPLLVFSLITLNCVKAPESLLLNQPGGQTGKTETVIRIASFNIKDFRNPDEARINRIVKIIEDNNLTILALQEIDPNGAVETLINSLTGNSDTWNFKLGGSGGLQRTAILYKKELIALPDKNEKELKASNTSGIIEEANWGSRLRNPLFANIRIRSTGKFLTVLVLHLKALGDMDSCMRRQAQVDDLDSWLETLSPETDFVMLGDYNDQVKSGAGNCDSIDTLNSLESDDKYVFLTDVEAGHFARGNATWLGTGTLAPSIIDHILINKDLLSSVKNLEGNFKASVIVHGDRDGISDHQPVYFELDSSK